MLLPVDCVLRAQSTFCWDDSRINCKFSVSLPQTNSNILSTVVEFGESIKIGLLVPVLARHTVRPSVNPLVRHLTGANTDGRQSTRLYVSTVVEHGTGTL